MNRLYIVIPAYNEEENIEHVVEDWYPIIRYGELGSKMVVIDDGSKDTTYSKLVNMAKSRPDLIVLTKPNGGHGDTVLFAYQYALEHGADYIFQTDSDGQTDPSEFAQFWNIREQEDLVIGNRNSRKDGLSRIFVTKVLRLVLWMIFGEWITDANTPYRLMKKDDLSEWIKLMPEHYNLPNVIISVAYIKNHKKVKYLPITFKARQGGKNSINMKKIMAIGVQALLDFRMIKKNMKRMQEQ